MHRRPLVVTFALIVALVAAALAPPGTRVGAIVERVTPNDNRRPAGELRDSALVLRLEARVAMWHPHGDSAAGAPTPAFAEAGGPPRIPGPLIRVRAGTTVDVRVTNTLAETLVVHGLYARPAQAQGPLTIAPGEARDARFRLSASGTYHYWGTTTRRAIDFRTLTDAQLTGAIVVDDSTAPVRDDRVFVLGMWTDTVHRARTRRQRILGVINGRSWPQTERLQHAVGDTVRWRVINASADLHPMHLHGFYFRVTRRGDEARDSAANDLVVTDQLGAGGTMEMTWVPERPGNWLFHCHIPEHFSPRGSLGLSPHGRTRGAGHANHANDGMNGLVMGVHVQPGRAMTAAQSERAPRQMRLLVRPRPGSSQATPRYSYTLHEGGREPDVESREGAPTLDLTRGDPVRITIVNRLPDATAVHWHGIELESYFDGVPGFSGIGKSITPLIAPGDSFEVRFTPPRSGTFIYHTHADEERQQMAGLAGAIVVSEPGHPRDHRRDIPIVLGQRTTPGAPAFGVDGNADLSALELTAGVPYRLRFVQIDANFSVLRVELRHDSAYASWRLLAKDGAELPGDQRVPTVSRVRLGIGETFDVEVTPDTLGAYRLELAMGLRYPLPSPVLTRLPIRVIPR
jgi:FtsP/CotA-like multicopper oxidase with cupredoxin domain